MENIPNVGNKLGMFTFLSFNLCGCNQYSHFMATNIYISEEQWEKHVAEILLRLDKIDRKIDRLFVVKDCLDGDMLLDNQDLCNLLGVTKRTIQRYRQKNLLKYYMIDNGKAYYLKSELPEFLLKRAKK